MSASDIGSPVDLQRYALVVDKRGGALTFLAPLFKDLGLRVLLVTTVRRAVDIVMKHPGVAIIVMSGEMGPVTLQAFAATLRSLHPTLPLVWAASNEPPAEVTRGPYWILPAPGDDANIRAQLQVLVQDGYYPRELTTALLAAARAVLSESFKVEVLGSEGFLRFNQSLLTDVSALVAFWSTHLCGRVIVGGSTQWFKAQLPAAMQSTPAADADLAGELCNRIVGRFKEFFERRGVTMHQGTPLLILGHALIMRDQQGPSMAYRLIVDKQDQHALYLEVSLQGMLLEVAQKSASGAQILSPGEVMLL